MRKTARPKRAAMPRRSRALQAAQVAQVEAERRAAFLQGDLAHAEQRYVHAVQEVAELRGRLALLEDHDALVAAYRALEATQAETAHLLDLCRADLAEWVGKAIRYEGELRDLYALFSARRPDLGARVVVEGEAPAP